MTPDLSWEGTCVVGAGPAGLALALRLADQDVPVLLIDGGGPGLEPLDDDVHGGELVAASAASDRTDPTLTAPDSLYGRNHLLDTRYRGPGGASWRWGVRGRPDADRTLRLVAGAPADFEPRSGFDNPGWPESSRSVVEHVPAAMAFFGLDGHTFDLARYGDEHRPLPVDPSRLSTKLFHFARGETIGRIRVAEAARHGAVRFQTGWTLTGLAIDRVTDRVRRLSFVDQSGQLRTVSASKVVLALGGVENSRQLLLAAAAGQLENRHDTLGRWFFDHPHVRLGYLPGDVVERADWYDFQEIEGTFVLRGHEIPPNVARAEDLLRFAVDLVGRHPTDATSTGFALAAASDAVARRRWSTAAGWLPELARHPLAALRLAKLARSGRVHNTALGGWSSPERLLPVGALSVEAMFEQRPSPDNRVRLSDRRDRHGRALPVVQWSWSSSEVDAVRRAVDYTAQTFGDAGIGPMTPLDVLGQGPVPRAGSGAHHLGGTRMSDDPAEGVVDPNSRVHGTENLFVAGSSVFPNSVGYANPTLTVVANTLRLADHLSRRQMSATLP